MKYSSVRSLAFKDERTMRPSGRPTPRLDGAGSRLQRPQRLDTANHNVAANLVHVKGVADRPQQHDRQPPAEMLLEFDETAQHVPRVAVLVEVLRHLGRV